MAQQWMGFTISIDCGPMGVFQGVVTAVEAKPQSVTLSRVFHNGVPHSSPSIVISALDIKDLTIIAAPQAQLDPVVELKKPIPTRPDRQIGDGAQNFHSQPAPPRALHLNDSLSDPLKAAELLSYEHQVVKNDTLQAASLSTCQPSAAAERSHQSCAASVQLSALQAALPNMFKASVTSHAAAQATASANTQPDVSGIVRKVSHILNLGPAASLQAFQGNRNESVLQEASHTGGSQTSSQGSFKLTSALAPHQGQHLNGIQTKHFGVLQEHQASTQRGPQLQAAQAALQGVLLATSGLGDSKRVATYSAKAAQGLPSGLFQINHIGGCSPRDLQSSNAQSRSHDVVSESLQRNSAQAALRGSSAQAFQGAAALTQSQAVPTQARTQRAVSQASLQVHTDGYASGSGDGNRTPNRRDRQRQRWQARDEACFGSPANNGFDQEFDFEKNLALFDKQAVYDQIAIQRPDLVQGANGQRRQQNYRHDQNVIVNNRRIPTIIVPNPGSVEYVTDDGLIIPSMRPELLRQLHQKAHDFGFSFDRQSELLARCATEMSLQLLGGAHRLNPHNSHQWPTVTVMVGPHSQGAAGVMCARQLECQGVSTVTLVVNEAAAPTIMKRELNLYKCGGAPIVTSTEQLPDTVDLVIMALAGHQQADVANSLEYGKAASWASNKRAPVLALDPPPVGTPGIITKFALVPTLPLTYSPQNGKIYLCNLGVPIVVFKEMGIKYRSPFGSKFVIPLHPNDE